MKINLSWCLIQIQNVSKISDSLYNLVFLHQLCLLTLKVILNGNCSRISSNKYQRIVCTSNPGGWNKVIVTPWEAVVIALILWVGFIYTFSLSFSSLFASIFWNHCEIIWKWILLKDSRTVHSSRAVILVKKW